MLNSFWNPNNNKITIFLLSIPYQVGVPPPTRCHKTQLSWSVHLCRLCQRLSWSKPLLHCSSDACSLRRTPRHLEPAESPGHQRRKKSLATQFWEKEVLQVFLQTRNKNNTFSASSVVKWVGTTFSNKGITHSCSESVVLEKFMATFSLVSQVKQLFKTSCYLFCRQFKQLNGFFLVLFHSMALSMENRSQNTRMSF